MQHPFAFPGVQVAICGRNSLKATACFTFMHRVHVLAGRGVNIERSQEKSLADHGCCSLQVVNAQRETQPAIPPVEVRIGLPAL